jgi:hypothetical protein
MEDRPGNNVVVGLWIALPVATVVTVLFLLLSNG